MPAGDFPTYPVFNFRRLHADIAVLLFLNDIVDGQSQAEIQRGEGLS